ncbi:MAG: (Fe-S)-binding protein [Pseudomonadota bacterium]|nr:(Fe-S)-binding protein [Pseudomonadota bacterium]
MKVGLFVTCLVDAMRPEIGFASLKLLEAAGCEVFVPEAQTCCGQPAYNSGDAANARELAAKTLREFESFDYMVVPSGSCAAQLKIHSPRLLQHDAQLVARARQLAARTYELTDFLTNVAARRGPSTTFSRRVTYHDSCSGLRELGIKRQPRALLAHAGVELTEMKDCEQCCGFGGAFAVKYGDISGAIVDEKCRHIQASGADTVVLGDLGCILNIEGRLQRLGDDTTRVLHVAQVLAGEA